MEDWKLRLKQAREARGLNKTTFAGLVKVSNPTVTDWEKAVADGGIKEIAGVNLTSACSVLGVTPHWLMHGTEPKYSNGQAPSPEPSSQADRHRSESPLADSFKLEIETAAELRLLSVYRLANSDGRAAIDAVVERIRQRLDVDSAAGNKG